MRGGSVNCWFEAAMTGAENELLGGLVVEAEKLAVLTTGLAVTMSVVGKAPEAGRILPATACSGGVCGTSDEVLLL